MNPTYVVIHFIGLVLFSTHVSNDPGLHAILPAIRRDVTHGETFPTQIAPASASTHIEPHVALLVFPADIVLNDSQWNAPTVVSKFPTIATDLASYKYVELTGEHIMFIVDAPNDSPAVLPLNMPRFSCGKTSGLTSGYQFPYAKAAAVVDIPEGKLSVCEARANAPGRIDTRLVLNTTGTLTIVAYKSGVMKTLLLSTASSPTIYIANVPPPGKEGIAAASNLSGHFRAYYGMIGKNPTSTCSGPSVTQGTPLVPDCDMKTIFPTGPTTAVVSGSFAQLGRRIRALFRPGGTTGTHVPEFIIPSVNAECSNSQWP